MRRKLLILARAAGLPLQAEAVEVESIVPPALLKLPLEQLERGLALLDAPVAERFRSAHRQGAKLRLIGSFHRNGQARVGLQTLPPEHPLCAGSGTDNKVAIHSDRYDQQPLLIQGPGAGAEVTAAALLDDVLEITRQQRQ